RAPRNTRARAARSWRSSSSGWTTWRTRSDKRSLDHAGSGALHREFHSAGVVHTEDGRLTNAVGHPRRRIRRIPDVPHRLREAEHHLRLDDLEDVPLELAADVAVGAGADPHEHPDEIARPGSAAPGGHKTP